MATAYGYARASTEEQTATLQAQAELIVREFGHRLAGEYTWGQVFYDRAVSGATEFLCRPEGYKLATELAPGDAILVTKLDRGFRNTADLCNMLVRWKAQSVRLLVLDLGLDTGTLVGTMLAQILAAVAEFERAQISLRTKAVLDYRRRHGIPWGACPWGFRYVGPKGQRKMVPDQELRAMAARIVEWRQAGFTSEMIYFHLLRQRIKRAATGREWSMPTIQRAYQRELQLRAVEAAAQAKADGTPEKAPPASLPSARAD